MWARGVEAPGEETHRKPSTRDDSQLTVDAIGQVYNLPERDPSNQPPQRNSAGRGSGPEDEQMGRGQWMRQGDGLRA